MTGFGRALTALGAVAAVAGAATIIPPSDPPQRTAPAVTLTAAYLPLGAQQSFQEVTARAAIPKSESIHAAITPRATRPTPPSPPSPAPVVTAAEFEDAIINTYHAIEPWVRYGFELGTYAVGWVPWVGWLAPQIMIFYNFGERIVESLVVNSANWLWGPLPFGEGLANIARDSWDALVQLGRDEWNFWLPPLPPLPFTAEQTADPAQHDIVGTADESAAGRPHPVRDALLAVVRSLSAPGLDAPRSVNRPRWINHTVQQVADTESAIPADDVKGQADSGEDGTTPTDVDQPAPDPSEPADAAPDDAQSVDATDESQQSGRGDDSADKSAQAASSEDRTSPAASHTPRFRITGDSDRGGFLNRRALRGSTGNAPD